MRLEHLPEGSPDCPLIRLYEFSRAEARQLRDLVHELSVSSRDHIALHEQPVIQVVGGCRLHLRLGDDRGIRHERAGHFECVLSPSSWHNIEGLIHPFCESDVAGYQWLSEHGDISLLISRDGSW